VSSGFQGFISRNKGLLATIVSALVVILEARDGRKKSISDHTTGINSLEAKLTTRISDVETKLTKANQITNALILTTATKTMQGLDGNKKHLTEWLMKSDAWCRAQYGQSCASLNVGFGEPGVDNGKPVGGANK